MEAVTGVFAKENGQGLFFPRDGAPESAAAAAPDPETSPPASSPNGGRPRLQVIK
jgi:stringent starvation protein B